MKYKIPFFLMLCLLLLIACMQTNPVTTAPSPPSPDDGSVTSPTPGGDASVPNPYGPGKGDESMQRGNVFIDSTDILTLESYPLQFQLHVKGSLPTPCHQLRVIVDQPDLQNEIKIQIYSLVDPNAVCAQMLEPFEANLALGSFPSGTYTVLVNGEKIGEIKA